MTYVQAHFKESLQDLELDSILRVTGISVWKMRRPNSGYYRVQITFSPEGIALQGDVKYGNMNGVCSGINYGLDWFSGSLSEKYLCAKFLQQKWVPEYAIKILEDELAEPEQFQYSEEMRIEISETIEEIKTGAIREERLGYRLAEIGYDISEMPGYGYDPAEAMALCGVQQKFAELYQDRLRDDCKECGSLMVDNADVTGKAKDSQGWVWCPICFPHDGIKRTLQEFKDKFPMCDPRRVKEALDREEKKLTDPDVVESAANLAVTTEDLEKVIEVLQSTFSSAENVKQKVAEFMRANPEAVKKLTEAGIRGQEAGEKLRKELLASLSEEE